MSEAVYCKVIDIADFSDPELLPYLKFVAQEEMGRFGLTEPVILPDSKQWECAMMLRTFEETGTLRPGALFAGIGAGTEQTTFALAAKGAIVFPTDRYLERTPWSDVAPPGMMIAPENFSSFEVSRGAVIPVHTDARALRLPSNTFDGVYSAGSIEHFGSLDAVAAAAEEIGRILKPGGVAALTTEFRLDGPNDRAWFDDNCILFTPELIQERIIDPSGLTALGEACWDTSEETFDRRVVLLDFLNKAKNIRSIADKRNAYPNLVLHHEGFLFCSVHLAMRKPVGVTASTVGLLSREWEPVVAVEGRAALRAITKEIATGVEVQPPPEPTEDPRVAALEAQLHQFRTSRSFRLTQPIRSAADQVRRRPSLHELAHKTANLVRRVRGPTPNGTDRS